MAGVLVPRPPLLCRPLHSGSIRSGRRIRVSAELQETVEVGGESSKPTLTISPPPGFKAPEPKRFAVRPDKFLDILGASLALPFRLGSGVFTLGYSASFVSEDSIPSNEYALSIAGMKLKETSKLGPRPEKPIEIYEFESCPFCRKVREIVSILDVDVLFYPCPRNGPNFRPKVLQMGGKQQFPYMVSMHYLSNSGVAKIKHIKGCPPYLPVKYEVICDMKVDPNTGVSMYESDDIIRYLVNKYGDGTTPLLLSLGLLTTLTAGFAMIGRMGKGSSYTASKLPPQPLEFWAYEGSPFCKVVREVLVELELPHILRSTARGSPKRQILYEKAGHFQVPYLEDPNTGVKTFESADIIDYLRATYTI